jgi:hypothetical protein
MGGRRRSAQGHLDGPQDAERRQEAGVAQTGQLPCASDSERWLLPHAGVSTTSWIIEIIHHAVAAKLLQHSAITPSVTYGVMKKRS